MGYYELWSRMKWGYLGGGTARPLMLSPTASYPAIHPSGGWLINFGDIYHTSYLVNFGFPESKLREELNCWARKRGIGREKFNKTRITLDPAPLSSTGSHTSWKQVDFASLGLQKQERERRQEERHQILPTKAKGREIHSFYDHFYFYGWIIHDLRLDCVGIHESKGGGGKAADGVGIDVM